jgi:O-antigen ligase
MPRDSIGEPAASRPADKAGWLAAMARFGFAGLLGLACVPLASAVAGLETRYMVAVCGIVAGLVALPLLGSPARVRMVMTIGLALGLSVGLSISVLHHIEVAGSFVPFVGGAEAVTISLSLLATLGYIVAEAADRFLYNRRRGLRISWLLVVPPVLFMLAGLLSLTNAWDSTLVWLEELRLVTLLLATLVTMNLTRGELRAYVLTLAASVVLQCGLAVVQFATGRTLGLGVLGEATLVVTGIDYSSIIRPTGTLGDPNILSYFFEITAPVMLALFYAERDGLSRLLYALATVAAVAGAVATYSRASWATLPVTFGFITVMVWGRRIFSLRSALTALLLGACTAAALVYAWPLLAKRLFGDDAGSFGQRMPLDKAALSVLEQFPVFGVGLNNFAVSFTRYDTTHYSRVFVGGDHVVHNLHLLVWTEVGTVGFLAYLAFFGSAFLAASRVRADPWARALALGCAAGLGAHLIHGMVDPGFKLSLTISVLISAQIGVIGRLYLHDNDRAPATTPARTRSAPNANACSA